MTARDYLIRLRRSLVAALLLRAVAFGAAIAIAGLAVSLSLRLPMLVPLALGVMAAGTAVALAARAGPARSLERVALWVEERHPALRYALVTAAADGVTRDEVERQALQHSWWQVEQSRLARSLVSPAGALVAAIALFVWLPQLVRLTGVRGALHSSAPAAGMRTGADPLARIRVDVEPPRYAGRAPTAVDDPTGVDALVGSTIVVSGTGDAAAVSARLDSAASPVAAAGGGRWSTSFVMPARPLLLHLRAATGRERLVVLAPVADAVPMVTLVLPARDTVVLAAAGAMVLRAELRDDIGLRDAAFEIIVSSGQQENFTFRTATLGRVQLSNRSSGAVEVRVSLDSLALAPGDVLQVRAVARDGNTVTGQGVGSSDTRALRVARAGEYDTVAVEAAPPGEPDGQALSQRMLITLTEALERQRPRLARPVLVSESQRLASDQARLRKRVGDVVFQRTGGEPLSEESTIEAPAGKLTAESLLSRAEAATRGTVGEVMDVEGDETPILAVNKPLLEAFNAMWDAGRALEQGDTRRALPPMRRALAAIERARRAERIYLRGRPSAVVVDVARARLAGKERGAPAMREARSVEDPARRRRSESFARATSLLARDPDAAADTLLVMRVGALGDAPALAAMLDAAARAVRGADAGAIALAWAGVRRALGGAPIARDSLTAWGGAP